MPIDGHVLRVFGFRPVGSEFDAFLRTVVLPDAQQLPGLLAIHAGRRDQESGGDRVVASVWEDRAAMIASAGETQDATPFDPSRLSETIDRTLEVLEVRIELPLATSEAPTLLRLFRGTVKPGELDAYIDEVRTRSLADTAAGRGPAALYLAADPPERFVTVSLWPSWDAIAEATGGDIRRPTTTKDSQRLVGIDVAHYELVREAD